MIKFGYDGKGLKRWKPFPCLRIEAKDIEWNSETFNDLGLLLDVWTRAFTCGIGSSINPMQMNHAEAMLSAMKQWSESGHGVFLFGIRSVENFGELPVDFNPANVPSWVELAFIEEGEEEACVIMEGECQQAISVPMFNQASVYVKIKMYSPIQ